LAGILLQQSDRADFEAFMRAETAKMETRAESSKYSGAVRATTPYPTSITGPDHDDTI
jgi:hypothetical protein